MNYNILLRNRNLFVFTIVAALLLFSCKENDSNEPIGTSPEIPPVVSLQMDFNNFPASISIPKFNENDAVLTKGNWTWAFQNGVFWQTLVTVAMVVPVAAFVESFNHDAEMQPDGTWLWTYDFTPPGGVKHTASLSADVDNSGVNWNMYISKENHFTDFLWFSGKSNLFATEGTWTLNYEPNDPSPWLGIEWHRNPEDSTADIKYINIIPDGAENGGHIYYGTTTDSTYDAFYEIFNNGKDNTISINWNRTSHIGQVRDSLYFSDYDWHCWDENLDDIDCP